MRVVRDPVHGDIALPPLQSAVIGSLVFQRLRYIRQNGLLHFVFPGAVHTRFAHSIGTMANAAAVWQQLTVRFEQETSVELRSSLAYVGTIFQLAALLHDVGHCAFSHSAEQVTVDGQPLFGTVEQLFTAWGESTLLASYEEAKPGIARTKAEHEEIGILLVRRLFKDEEQVGVTCNETLGSEPAEVALDVVALLKDVFPPTPRFLESASIIARRFGGNDDGATDLRRILNRLVSGTLDVDRMDYLLRDSMFCGVPYGRYERQVLISALDILPIAERLELCLSAKAALALDDLLWSRHQMFAQVYNHKTNVAMNYMLGLALEYAFQHVHLMRPRSFEEYLAFTDDLVMGKVFQISTQAQVARETVFGRTLTRRFVPKHLGSERLLENAPDARAAEVASKKAQVAAKHHLDETKILALEAKSELLKRDSQLPLLYLTSKTTGGRVIEPFESRSMIVKGHLEPLYRRVHFFELPQESIR